ncbi:MAG: hypothetical protein AB1689_14070 [Thermodesulfobacteriota bacterium]
MAWLRVRGLLLACVVLALACGGGDGNGGGTGELLFSGSAGELVPHALGRSAVYRVTATVDGASEVSSFSSTVTEDGADGVFQTRFESATGALARSVSRDTGSEVRVERFVNDPGGPDERDARLDPPVVVVRTPVVAGDAIETSFARPLDLALTVGGTVRRRQVLFVGSARRVPEAREEVTVPAGTFEAVRYAVSARGEATIPILGERIRFTADVAGDEWFAPRVGGVKEVLDVTLRAGEASTEVRFVTERVSSAGAG